MSIWQMTDKENVIRTVSFTLKMARRKGVATMTKPTPATDCENEAPAIIMLAYTISLNNLISSFLFAKACSPDVAAARSVQG
jgi:hypothetical protein